MVSSSRSTTGHPRPVTLIPAVDVAIGFAATAVGTARAGALRLTRAGRRPARMLRIPSRLTPVRSLHGACNSAARRGRDARARFELKVGHVVRALALDVVCAVLEELDLTAIVRERADINAVAEDLDVDAVVARLTLDSVVDRLDLNTMVDRVDLDH